MKQLILALTTLFAVALATSTQAAAFDSGAFSVSNITSTDASSCTASDGVIRIAIDPSDAGAAPYDVSIDNGATWILNNQAVNASNELIVSGRQWGGYALAVRDANDDIVYPGHAVLKGCEFEACSPANSQFTSNAVANATGYTWTTSVGTITSGQNTTTIFLDLAAETPGSIGEVCVQPTGPQCSAPPTCFDVLVKCPEDCSNGIDDDLDGLTDCDDPDCGNPIANAGSNQNACAGDAVTLSATASGGTPPYTYSWNNGGGSGQTVSVSPTSTTNYTVTVTDANGCTATDVVRINHYNLPTATITTSSASCGATNGSITLTTPPTGDRPFLNFSIDGGSSFPSGNIAVGGNTHTFSNLAPGNYSVWARWNGGICPTFLQLVEVTENLAPTVSIAAVAPVCADETVTFTTSISGGTGPFSYSWSGGLPAVANPTFTPPGNPTSHRTTTYTVTVTDAYGCTATASRDVVAWSDPIASASGSDAHCGQADGSITISFTDNSNRTNIEFSSDGGNNYLPSVADNSSTYTISGLAAGTYNIYSRWGDGTCPTAVGSITIADLPAVTVAAGSDQNVCPSTSVTLTAAASGGTGGLSYSWDNGLGSGSSVTFTATTTRNYTVTASDAFGCSSSDVVRVVVEDNTPPTFGTVPADVTVQCDAIPTMATVTASDNCTSPTVTPAQAITAGACADSYTITRTWVADDGNGNTASTEQIITVIDDTSPTFANVPAPVDICEGEAIPTNLPDGNDNCDSAVDITAAAPVRTNGIGNAYTLTRVFTATDNCGNTATTQQVISVSPVPDVTAFAKTDPTCGLNNGSIQLSWSAEASQTNISFNIGDGNGFAYNSPVASTSLTIPSLAPGTYAIQARWGGGTCAVSVGTLVLTQQPGPNVSVATPADICETETVTLTAVAAGNGPLTYLWDNAAGSTASVNVSPGATQTYTVTVTDINGCTTSASATVTVQTLPLANINASAGNFCHDVARDFLASDNGSGHIYSWNFGSNASPATASGIGPHSVTFTSTSSTSNATASVSLTVTNTATGCSATDNLTRTVLAEPSVAINTQTNPTTCGGSDGEISFGVSLPTTSDYELSIDGGANWASCNQSLFSGLSAGTYNVQIRYCNDDCPYAVTTITLTDPVAPVAAFAKHPGSECEGESISFLASSAGAGATYAWNFGAAASPATATGIGPHAVSYASAGNSNINSTATLTVTANGCVDTDTELINVRPVLEGSASSTNPSSCGGTDGEIELAGFTPPGGSVVQFSIDGGSTYGACNQTIFTGLAAGGYDIFFRYCNSDCPSSIATVILSDPAPPIGLIAGDDTICDGETATFSVTGAPPLATYNWSFGAGASPATATGPGPHTVTYTGAGTRTPSVSMLNLGCTSDLSKSLEVFALPVTTIAVSETSGPTDDDGRVCAGATVNLTASGASTYVWSTGETTATIAVAPTTTTLYTVTGTSTEGCTTDASFTITVEDVEPPVFTFVPPAVTLECSDDLTQPDPTVVDACNALDEVVLVETVRNQTCADAYELVRDWTATDLSGNTATAQQVVTVRDITAPVLTSVPVSKTISCADARGNDLPIATDNCDTNVDLTFADVDAAGPCPGEVVVTRTFTAVDNCGNTATATQLITIEDNTPPVFAGVPSATTIACGASLPTAMPSVSDDCGQAVSLVETTVSGPASCAGDAVIRTFTATDACGNTAVATQLVTFEDTTAPAFASVPADVTLDCGDALPTDVATATDVCDSSVNITSADVETARTSPNAYEITRTFTATDACGNTATATQVITYQDTGLPTWTSTPADATLECGAALPTDLAVAEDACDGPLTVSFTDATAAGCGATTIVTRTFTATDADGNLISTQQVITFEDTTAPAFASVPADVTLDCGDSLPTDVATATDVCDASVAITSADVETARTSPNAYEITRTFTATDACGNTATATQLITYQDTGIPTWTSTPADATLECGAALPTDLAVAEDGCDGPLTVSYTDATATGCGATTIVTRTFTATDADGNLISTQQVITFEDTTAPAFASVPADVTLDCGDALPTDVATATDACDASVTITSADVETSRTSPNAYEITRTFTATDACGNTATATQVITYQDTGVPTWTSTPADATLECGAALPTDLAVAEDACDGLLTVSFTDATAAGCGATTIVTRTFTATDADGNLISTQQVITFEDTTAPAFASVPADVTLDCGDALPTDVATATDVCDPAVAVNSADVETGRTSPNAYEITRTFTATDACGNTATATQLITYQDTGIPTWTSTPADATLECGATLPTDLAVAEDGCDGPLTVSFTDATAAGCGATTIVTRTFTATDADGNLISTQQVITFDDTTAPAFASVPADVTLDCGDALPTDVATATDVCDAAVAVTSADVETARTSPNAYEITRTFTATDACGNTAIATQVITYQDTGLPTWTSVPGAATLECGAALPTDLAVAEDGCDGPLTVLFTDATAAGCGATTIVTRTFTATDADGNMISTQQVITFEDTTAPAFASVPADVTLDCGDALPTDVATATDVCDSNVSVSSADVETGRTSPNAYEITRTFTATDACGNTATATQLITFQDTGLPTWTSTPADATLECGAALPTDLAVAEDGCDGPLTVSYTDATATGCGATTIVTRTFTATDADGNLISTQQVITFEDTTAPAFASVPADVTLDCGNALPTDVATATDICDSSVNVSSADVETGRTSPNAYEITRTFTATDACGNTATATQLITFQDTGLPTWTSTPADATLECGAALPTDLAVAEDGCDGPLTVSYTDATATGCGATTIVTRTFTATDADGNLISTQQVITFEDTTAPAFASVPADVTLDCGNALPTDVATATDICDSSVNVSSADVETGRTSPNAYEITRTFTATDACGNTATATQVITFQDTGLPTWTSTPADATLECGASLPTDLAVAEDGCDGSLTVSFTDATATGCGATTIVTRTFTATDADGNLISTQQVITFEDTTAPAFASVPADVTLDCGDALPTDVATATDVCDAAVAVTSADVETGRTSPNAYEITRTFTATDACGNTATAIQVITYQDTGLPTWSSTPADATLECGAALPTDLAVAEDGCDGPLTVSFTDATATGCGATTIVTRTFTASDADGNLISTQQVITFEDTTAPAFASVPADVTLDCGDALPTDVATATDVCDAAVAVTSADVETGRTSPNAYEITRTFTATDACGNTAIATQVITYQDTGLPTWTSVPGAATLECGAALPTDLAVAEDGCDGPLTVSFTDATAAGCGATTIVTRTFTATDADGNLISTQQVITFEDTTAPAFASVPADVTLDCGDALPTDVATATDVCDAAVAVTSADVETARTSPNAYEITRTFTATDACGNTARATQLITYQDTGLPTWTSTPADATLECGAALPTDLAVAEDGCDGPLPVSFTDATAAGCGATTIVTRTFTASDADGNLISTQQVITFEDTTAPAFASVPADVTLDCGDALPTDVATATDVCDSNVSVTSADLETGRTSPNAYEITRTFTATDACGNTATATQVITFQDTGVPTWTSTPADATLECGATLPTDLAVAEDGCDGPLTVTFTDATAAGCGATTIVTRTFTATDADGNLISTQQVITFEDTTAPAFASVPADVTLDCGDSLPTDVATATDVCDASVAITSADVETARTSPNAYEITRTFTATDACGNTATATQLITYQDTGIPTWTSTPADATLECGAALPTDLAVAEDGCDGPLTVSYTDATATGCGATTIVTRTFTATDADGNLISTQQVITFEDTTAPAFASVPADVTLDCGDALPTDVATATDACDASVTITSADVETSRTSPNAYEITRTFTATDACGNTATATQLITYQDTGLPTWTSTPADATLECGAALPTDLAVAEDGCDGPLTVSYTDATATGCGATTIVTRTFTATDADGNLISTQQVITFEDTTAPAFASVPADVTLDCGDALPTDVATATDVCDSSVSISSADVETGRTSPNAYEITRTFTATDACGNTATATQLITFQDTGLPTWTSTPADATLECGAALPTDLAVAEDGCDGPLTVSYTDATAAGCGATTIVTRTFTATDADGNSISTQQVITFEDTTAPAFASVPADVTLDCGDALPTDVATATDICDSSVNVSSADVETGRTSPNAYEITRTFTATDACGNTATATQLITFQDTGLPTWSSTPADATLECGAALPTDLAVAEDGCDGPLTVSFTDATAAGCGAATIVTRTFTASDADGNLISTQQVITFEDTTAPAFASVPADVTLDCGDALPTDVATATDVCDASVAITSADVETARTSPNAYEITRTFTATDACGNTATATQLITYQDTGVPTWTSTPADATLECGAALPTDLAVAEDGCDGPLTVSYTDATAAGCGATTIVTRTFTATDADGNSISTQQVITFEDTTAPAFASVPADVTLDCGDALPTDVATATDICDSSVNVSSADVETGRTSPNAYEITRTFTATDACGNTATATQLITFQDTGLPTWSSTPADATLECGAALPTDLAVAEDGCDGPLTVSFTDATAAGCGAATIVTRTFTASDADGNLISTQQVITFEDTTAPAFASVPADVTLDCGDALPTDVATATDVCDSSVSVSSADVETGRTSPNAYEITRTFTATDACGNTATATQVITYQDTGLPTWTSTPADATLECGAALPTDLAVAEDGCDGALTVTFTDATAAGCGATTIVTRTFTASDADGNLISTQQVITFEDTTAPAFASVPADVTLDCGDALPTDVATATDVCDAAVAVTSADVETARTSPNAYEITRTFTATDACGNTATATQLITFQDTGLPTWTSTPADATLECGAALPTDLAVAEDGCDGPLTVSFTDATAAGCGATTIVTRTFTATDADGNLISTQQVFTFEDTTAPAFASVPADVTLDCGDALPTDVATATDVCDAAVAVNSADVETGRTSPNAYEITRTFTATDACGNTATATQVITFQDTGLPTWTSTPADATLECGAALPTDLAVAEDGCDGPLTVSFTDATAAGCGATTIVTRTFTATDADGNLISTQQVLTFEDTTAPAFASVPADVTLDCGDALPTDVATATDVCDASVAITSADVETARTSPNAYEITRTFTATDACGNTATATQLIAFTDSGAPTWTFVPGSVTIACGDAVPTDLARAEDSCDGQLNVSYIDATTTACGASFRTTRTFSAMDADGNRITAVQVIEAEDVTPPVLTQVPTNTSIECGEALPTTLPSALDACDNNVDIAVAVSAGAPGCAGSEVVRTFTATDACGNSAVATQVVTIEDTAPPVFVTVPGNITVECGDNVPTDAATAMDVCSSVTMETVVTSSPSGCAAASIIRTFTATDGCGNTAVATQVVSFEDTSDPVFDFVPADVTITCNEPLPTAAATATDECTANLQLEETSQRIDGPTANQYLVIRTWTATDACGNVATATQEIAVVDDGPPAFTFVPADVTLACTAALPSVLAEAEDACDGVLSVSVSEVREDGSCENSYTIVRTFSASDIDGNIIESTQRVSFEDTVAPALANVPANTTVACGDALPSALPSATDNCSAQVDVTVEVSTAAGSCAGSSVVTRIFTATDACGNATTAQQIVTVEDMGEPTISAVPTDVTLACGEAMPSSEPDITDSCGDVNVAYTEQTTTGSCTGNFSVLRTWTATDGCGNAASATQLVTFEDSTPPVIENLTATLAVDCADAIPLVAPTAVDACGSAGGVTYTDTRINGGCAQSYSIVRVFSVADDCGNVATAEQRIEVNDTKAPVMANVPADVTIRCDEALPTALPTATDDCQQQVMIEERRITQSGPCANAVTYVRVFTATDACGNRSEARQRVSTYDDVPPVFTSVPGDAQLNCGEAVSNQQPIASDNCDTRVDIRYVEYTDPNQQGCGGRGALRRIWTATDNCGNAATVSQLVTFIDNIPPVLANVPRAVSTSCDDPLIFTPPTATDNCDTDVRVYFDDTLYPEECGTTVRRVWIAEDNCGNTSTGVQSILMIDEDEPVITSTLNDITLGCGEAFPEVELQAHDACDAELTVVEESFTVGQGSCPGTSIVWRIFTVSDDCGNQAVTSQVVTVVDETPPTFQNVPANTDVACASYDYSALQPIVSDACTDNVEVEETVESTTVTRGGDVFDAVLRTWTATDACGNVAQTSQQLVFNTENPLIAIRTAAGEIHPGGVACAGDAVTLTAPAGLTQYKWNTGATTPSITVVAEVTQNFYVEYHNDDFSCSGSASANLTVVEAPAFVIKPLPEFCEGQHVTLSVDAPDATQVTWTGPLNFQATGAEVTIEYIAGLQAGIYTATAQSESGCQLMDTVEVRVGFGACAEICDNGIDDDGDGLVDCLDPSCSCCTLSDAQLRTECRDQGTPNDLTDDTYAVFTTLTGDGISGKAFRVSGSVDLPTIYAGGEVLLGEFASTVEEVEFSFTNVQDASCALLDQQISSPGFCTNGCNVSITALSVGECVEGQYDLTVRVYYANPQGALNINGKRFVLDEGYGVVDLVLPKLSCTGDEGLIVEAYFEGLRGCTASSEYDAPCPDEACLPVEISLGDRP